MRQAIRHLSHLGLGLVGKQSRSNRVPQNSLIKHHFSDSNCNVVLIIRYTTFSDKAKLVVYLFWFSVNGGRHIFWYAGDAGECKISLAMDLAKVLDNDSKCWMLLENMGTPCLRRWLEVHHRWGNLAKSYRGIAPDKSCAFCLESDAKSCVTTERKR
jgi:hypothetical protein